MPQKPGNQNLNLVGDGSNVPSFPGTAVEVGAAQIQQVTGKKILTKAGSGGSGLHFQGNQAQVEMSSAQNPARDSSN